MSTVVYVIAVAVNKVLSLMAILMLVRAVLSWLPVNPDHPLISFVYAVTEFIVAPVRTVLFLLFPRLEQMPIDISFTVAYFILLMLDALLSYFV